MRLLLNGLSIDVEVETLAVLLDVRGFGKAKVATAVNGAFVPVDARAAFELSPGDMIEVLAPMQGG